jgi:outer membrane protein assembly factor BamB
VQFSRIIAPFLVVACLDHAAEPVLRWSFATEGGPIYYSSPALGADGTVYVGSGGYGQRAPTCGLFALTPDGRLKWKYYGSDMEAAGTPAVGADGTIYFQDRVSRLFAVRPDGTLRWSYPLNWTHMIGAPCPAIAADGTIYVGAAHVYALTPEGALKWTYSPRSMTPVIIRSGPAVALDGTVYVAANGMFGRVGETGNALLALHPNGTLKWECVLADADWLFSSPAIGGDGTVYLATEIAADRNYLFAIRPDGTVKWRYGVTGRRALRASPVIGIDGTIYLGTKAGTTVGPEFLALNPDGTLKWRFGFERSDFDLYSSAAIGADGLVYFGAESGELYALNPNGTLAWKFQTNNGINWPSPVIDRQGTIYIGNTDGVVFALQSTSAGMADSSWPKHRQNSRNAGQQALPRPTVEPPDQEVPVGAAATFRAATTNATSPLSYQWQKDGTNIAGATQAELALANVQPGDAGSYTVVAVYAAGTATSQAATLTVQSNRISNVSVRTTLASGQTLIVGFVTDGPKSVLVRGIGPGMATVFPQWFAPGDVMADPKLELYNSGGTKLDENDNWNSSHAPIMTGVGAFPLMPGSNDSSLLALISGPYTAHLKGMGHGVVLVDVYDTTRSFAARVTNVSARHQVGTGANILIAGFVIDGTAAKALLVRGIGPALRDIWGVAGALADPKLEVYNAVAQQIAGNDNWDNSLVAMFDKVGAYRFANLSKDAALVVTLPPGAYTAQLSGVGGTTGDGVIEVYAVP